jgi:hypothetical protein
MYNWVVAIVEELSENAEIVVSLVKDFQRERNNPFLISWRNKEINFTLQSSKP